MANDNRSMKIVSGGQTGADRAAIDFAIDHDIEYGGWIPQGRLAEDGRISDSYSFLTETNSPDYHVRTKQNVLDTDGTLLLSHGELTGGTLLTRDIARSVGKPALTIDFQIDDPQAASESVRTWIQDKGIRVLNVAGSRASGDPLIYNAPLELLTLVFD